MIDFLMVAGAVLVVVIVVGTAVLFFMLGEAESDLYTQRQEEAEESRRLWGDLG